MTDYVQYDYVYVGINTLSVFLINACSILLDFLGKSLHTGTVQKRQLPCPRAWTKTDNMASMTHPVVNRLLTRLLRCLFSVVHHDLSKLWNIRNNQMRLRHKHPADLFEGE